MPDDPYFTTAEAEAYLGDLAPAAAEIDAGREVVESRFERICRVAFVPRQETETLSGDGGCKLMLRWPRVREVVSATDDGVVLDVVEVRPIPIGAYREAGWPSGVSNLEVVYEHGWPAPPAEVKRAALRYLKEVLSTGPGDDRAIRLDLESGSYQRAIAGEKRPTGIPDVDVVLADHAYRSVG